MNKDMCSFFYIYKEDDGEVDDFCTGCDGYDKTCSIYTPLKGTQLWRDFVAKDTQKIVKEVKEEKGDCVLWKLTIASTLCKKCKGKSETCLAHMTREEFKEHEEAYKEIERDFYESRMGKCE